MPHYRKLFKSNYIAAHDLEGRDDVHATIREVRMDEVQVPQKDEAEIKPVLYFQGGSKGFILNRTNGDTIAKLHGHDTDDWIGKRVTLFVESGVKAFGKKWDVIRVRDSVPPDQNGTAEDRTEVLQDESDLLTHGDRAATEPQPAPEEVQTQTDALYGSEEDADLDALDQELAQIAELLDSDLITGEEREAHTEELKKFNRIESAQKYRKALRQTLEQRRLQAEPVA